MPKISLYIKHILISILILCLLLAVIFIFKFKIVDYSLTDLSYSIIIILLIVSSVLISYIVYLLLGYHTRFEMEIWDATKNIAASKEQFRMLYESAPVPYFLLNKNAEINDPNKSALRFFGVVPEEIEGKNFF